MGGWARINYFLNKLEETLLVFLLMLMVLLAFLPILFRNVVSIGLIWIDPLLRHLVLWVALLGASIATRESRHIKIDLVAPYLEPGRQAVLTAVLNFLSAAVCLALVLPAVEFVREEQEVGKYLIGVIPIWVSQSIIPVMLAVIGLRFLFAAWRSLRQRIRP
ncbi:MAG: TRAP transporter small permease [Deltaproteobacteria bacterium]|nr:TRAP transporter small permease [Deltaproteobacteria bacterium]